MSSLETRPKNVKKREPGIGQPLKKSSSSGNSKALILDSRASDVFDIFCHLSPFTQLTRVLQMTKVLQKTRVLQVTPVKKSMKK